MAVRSRPWTADRVAEAYSSRAIESTRWIFFRARAIVVSTGMDRLLRGGGRVVANDLGLEEFGVRSFLGHRVDVARQPFLPVGLPFHLGGDVLDRPAIPLVAIQRHRRAGAA